VTASIDRERLATLKAREDEVFVARHPRSCELFQRAQAHMLDGVPMNWMTRWSSPFPPYVAEAHGARFTCVDGHEYVFLGCFLVGSSRVDLQACKLEYSIVSPK